MVVVKFKRIRNEFNHIEEPSYATDGSAGMDIRAAIKENITIRWMMPLFDVF